MLVIKSSRARHARRHHGQSRYRHVRLGGGRRPFGYEHAVGVFLRDMVPWKIFGSLTFEIPTPQTTAAAALRRWFRLLAKTELREHVAVAWAHDLQSCGGTHFHVLLFFTRPAPPAARWTKELRRLWRRATRLAGFTHFRDYDPELGAAFYLAHHAEWDWGVVCPRRPRCRRGHGCRVSRWPL
jgi:hypothetical protein